MALLLPQPRERVARCKMLAPPAPIRPARESDIPRILEIERLCFSEQWDYYQFKASLTDIFLVYLDSRSRDLAGFLIACCCKVAHLGIILRVAVHPDHQGKGIATQLLRASLARLRRLNLKEVELDVDIVKAGAIRLYEKVGFKTAAVVSMSDEDDDSFYIMRKTLSS